MAKKLQQPKKKKTPKPKVSTLPKQFIQVGKKAKKRK